MQKFCQITEIEGFRIKKYFQNKLYKGLIWKNKPSYFILDKNFFNLEKIKEIDDELKKLISNFITIIKKIS